MKWSYRFDKYVNYKQANEQKVGSVLYTIPRIIKHSPNADLTITQSIEKSNLTTYDLQAVPFFAQCKEYIEDIDYSGFISQNVLASTSGGTGQKVGSTTVKFCFPNGDTCLCDNLYYVNESGYYFVNNPSGDATFYNPDGEEIGRTYLNGKYNVPRGYHPEYVFGLAVDKQPANDAVFTDFLIILDEQTNKLNLSFMTDYLNEYAATTPREGISLRQQKSDVLNEFFGNCVLVKQPAGGTKNYIEIPLTVLENGSTEVAKWNMTIPRAISTFNVFKNTASLSNLYINEGTSISVITDKTDEEVKVLVNENKITDTTKLSGIFSKTRYDNESETAYRKMVDFCGNSFLLPKNNVVYHFVNEDAGIYFRSIAYDNGQQHTDFFDKNNAFLTESGASATALITNFTKTLCYEYRNDNPRYFLPVAAYVNNSKGYDDVLNNITFLMIDTVNNYYGLGTYDSYTKLGTNVSFIRYVPYGAERFSYWLRLLTNSGETPSDPYAGGGTSGNAGGGGSFDDSSDIIYTGGNQIVSGVKEMLSVYTPTPEQLEDLSSYLFGETFWDLVINAGNNYFFSDVSNYILSLKVFPIDIEGDGSTEIKVGLWGTGVRSNYVNTYIKHWESDEMIIEPYYGSFLDYDPYTKIEIFLPFIGTRSLNTDEVVGNTIKLKYVFDLLSGSCVVYILVNGTVRYQFNGEASMTIPINSFNYGGLVNAAISTVSAVASMNVMKSASVDAANIPMITSETPAYEARQISQAESEAKTGYSYGSSGLSSSINGIAGSKPQVPRTGTMVSNMAFLGVLTPYLTITRFDQSIPENYAHFYGYPSNITAVLGELEGMTVVENIHYENMKVLNAELSEIDNLLKSGVIL